LQNNTPILCIRVSYKSKHKFYGHINISLNRFPKCLNIEVHVPMTYMHFLMKLLFPALTLSGLMGIGRGAEESSAPGF